MGTLISELISWLINELIKELIRSLRNFGKYSGGCRSRDLNDLINCLGH